MRAVLKLACFILAVLIAAPPAGWSGMALAQGADAPIVLVQAEPVERRQPGLFRFLFGGNRQQRDQQIEQPSKPKKTIRKRKE